MTNKTVKYIGEIPFHIRPISVFAKTVQTSDCDVFITKGESTVKGNSAMQLIKLAIENGDMVSVSVDGPKEEEVLGTLINIILNS